MSTLKPLYPHQAESFEALKSAAARSRRVMFQASTGFGKTNLFCHMVHGARAKGRRVVFVVPAITLIDQTFERLVDNGIDPIEIGILQADHVWRRPHAPIQIATSQTLARRELPECDMVVIDEAHELHKVLTDWMAAPEAKSKLFIGLTATPWTKGLGKHFDTLVKSTPLRDLIAMGYLSPFRVFAPSHPDLTGVKTVAGDYKEDDLAERMSKPQLVADVVSTWLERGENRPTLCFAVNRAHAQLIRDQFEMGNVPVAYIDANTPREERTAIGKQLAAGTVKVVVNIGTLTKGVDWRVECLILARPTKSPSLFVQIIGRGLRTAPGKSDCVILDHSDSTLRLGFPTDIDYDRLDDGSAKKGKSAAKEREESVPLPKQCTACTGLVPAGEQQCPCCGHVMKRPPRVEVVDGELTELLSATKRGEKAPPVKARLAAKPRQEVWAEIKGFQEERGRSDGWSAWTYKSVYDVFPRGLDGVEAIPPSSLLRSWIRSRDIAWARSQKNTGGDHVSL